MTDYSEMTNAELDRLAGEVAELTLKVTKSGWHEWFNTDGSIEIGADYQWQPTHPDSNQAERYLFPKLLDEITNHIAMETHLYRGEYEICFTCQGEPQWQVIKKSDKKDQINRTKVIACLEAWEKLND